MCYHYLLVRRFLCYGLCFIVWFSTRCCGKGWENWHCDGSLTKFMSCFISVTVFSLVARNLGLQVWGMSGVTSITSAPLVALTTVEDKVVEPEEAFELADALERGIPERLDRPPSIL